MSFNVILTKPAKADLREIAAFIARDSKARAVAFVRLLEQKAADIGDAPNAFPLLADHDAEGIRRKPFRDYVIFYRVSNGVVEVLHILNSAKDAPLLSSRSMDE